MVGGQLVMMSRPPWRHRFNKKRQFRRSLPHLFLLATAIGHLAALTAWNRESSVISQPMVPTSAFCQWYHCVTATPGSTLSAPPRGKQKEARAGGNLAALSVIFAHINSFICHPYSIHIPSKFHPDSIHSCSYSIQASYIGPILNCW